MTTSNRVTAVIATLLLGVVANQSCRFEMSPACNDFYHNLSGIEQEDQFPTYPLEQQLEIYHCGMQYRPPMRIWAWEISKRGEAIVPDLVQRLNAEPDQGRQADLIYILFALSQRGCLHNREDIVATVREKVSHMGRSRSHAQDLLEEIEKNSKTDRPGEPSDGSD